MSEGDRNGEPSEDDWSCMLVLVCLAGVAFVLLGVLLGRLRS